MYNKYTKKGGIIKYRITLEHKENGIITKTENKLVEEEKKPKVGEFIQDLDKKITIISVNEVKEDPTIYWDRLSIL